MVGDRAVLLCSARTCIRAWTYHDDEQSDSWPPYRDPMEPLWNLPRQSGSNSWGSGFEWGGMRRVWAVEDYNGHLMGRISLREVDERRGQARLGITFGSPYVGRGLGTEALATFLDYYFTHGGFQTMVLDVAAPNQRAVRSYRRLGFRSVGGDWRLAGYSFNSRVLDEPRYLSLHQYFQRDGRGLWVYFVEMELRKDEWFATKNKTIVHSTSV